MADALNPKRHSSKRAIRALGTLISQEREDITSVVIYAITVGLFSLVIPIGVQTIVNNISFATFNQPIVMMLVVVFFALAIAGVLKLLQSLVVERLQVRLFVRSAVSLTEVIPQVTYGQSRSESQDVALDKKVNRFFDVLTVQKSIAGLLLDGVSLVLQGLIGLVLLAFYHPVLLAFDVVLVLSLVFAFYFFGRGLVRTAIEESYAKHRVAAWLEELAERPILFRLPLGQRIAHLRSNAYLESYIEARRVHFQGFLKQLSSIVIIQVVSSVALLAIGAYLVTQNQLSLGQLVAAELVVSVILNSLLKFEKHLDHFYDLTAALDKLQSLYELEQETHVQPLLPSEVRHGPASLEYRDVSFMGHDGEPLLRQVTVQIEPAQHTLILGPKGAGKSVMTSLAFGLAHPSQGAVLLDSRDLRDIPKLELRREVLLLRNLEIVPGSVKENIYLGETPTEDLAVHELLSRVGIYDDVLRLPEGVNTFLSPDGSPLSHQQARMLVLARTIALRPRLLVIDRFLDDIDEDHLHLFLGEVFKSDAPWTVLLATAKSDFVKYAKQTVRLIYGEMSR